MQVEVPNFSRNLLDNALLDEAGHAKRKLIAFGVNMLRQHKLVTRSFSRGIDLRVNARDRAKNIQALAEMIDRRLRRIQPTVALAAVRIRSYTSTPCICLEFTSSSLSEYFSNLAVGEGPRPSPGSVIEPGFHPEALPLGRYERYLNYLCRKSNVPISVSVTAVAEHGGEYGASICLMLAAWVPAQACAGDSTIFDFDRWLQERRSQARQEGRDPDSVFSDESLWLTRRLCDQELGSLFARYNNMRGGSPVLDTSAVTNNMHPSLGKRFAYEKLFLVLPNIMKCIQTLSRDFTYDPTAFTIQSAVNAGQSIVEQATPEGTAGDS